MKYKKIFSFLFILFFNLTLLNAQFDEEVVTGGTESAQDTSKVKQLLENSSMTGGLLDGAIDPKEYIVGPGDEFIINIVSSRSEQVKATISPDGRLLIRNVGVIDLKGKTLEESYELIETKARNVYNSKEISVILSNIRKFKVTVSGQTFTQATVAATSTERVNEVINKVGGFDRKSSLRNIRLIRKDSIIKVDLIKFFNIGDKSVNPYVTGGDQIIVPPFNNKSTIEINGEVPKKIEVEYIEGDSLSTLIKMSQGFLSSSDLSSVEISRLENDGVSVDKIYLDLTNWRESLYNSSSLPNDMDLQPGDRV